MSRRGYARSESNYSSVSSVSASSNTSVPVLPAPASSHQSTPDTVYTGISKEKDSTPNHSSSAHGKDGSSTEARQRQARRDAQIRKKLESDMTKRKNAGANSIGGNKTVNGLVLSNAYTVVLSASCKDAAQTMAFNKTDALLVTNESGDQLEGILTDKDLCFRVVAAGLDPHKTSVSAVMTKKPSCASTSTTAVEALNTMIDGHFRHLPVVDDRTIVGILDITKCTFNALDKMDRAYKSSKALAEAMENMQRDWAGNSLHFKVLSDNLREQMLCPALSSVVDGGLLVGMKSTVLEVSRLMKEKRATAVLIVDEGSLKGIFTTKDMVLRVIANDRNPESTSIVTVMTPNPDYASPQMTVIDALRKMHERHFLHLPVVDEVGQIIGIADVMQLTMSTMDQLKAMEGRQRLNNSGSESGSAAGENVFNSFWSSAINVDDERGSVYDDNISIGDDNLSVADESVSMVGSQVDESQFAFKVKDDTGTTVRFSLKADSFEVLKATVVEKLDRPGESFRLFYQDEEKDDVLLKDDGDLAEAVNFIRRTGQRPLLLRAVNIFPAAAAAATADMKSTKEVEPTKTSEEKHAGEKEKEKEKEKRKKVVEEEEEEDLQTPVNSKPVSVPAPTPAAAQPQPAAPTPTSSIAPVTSTPIVAPLQPPNPTPHVVPEAAAPASFTATTKATPPSTASSTPSISPITAALIGAGSVLIGVFLFMKLRSSDNYP